MKYLEFNNRSSEDFKLGIIKVNIGTPKPNLITEKVPYCNGAFDFSTVVTGGLKTYSDRTITVDFNYISDGQEDLYTKFSEMSSWLLCGAKDKLIFNYINGFYTGQCTELSTLDSFINYGKFTVTFVCNPSLKVGSYGDYIWDTFSFIDGISEIAKWTVNANDIISIFNKGIDVNPNLLVDSDITITLNNKTFELQAGENILNGLILKNGDNEIKILESNPNTTIQINFEKEMI